MKRYVLLLEKPLIHLLGPYPCLCLFLSLPLFVSLFLFKNSSHPKQTDVFGEEGLNILNGKAVT